MKIRLKLDTLLVLEDNTEVRYSPAAWPKDETGVEIPLSSCIYADGVVKDNRLQVKKDEKKDEITVAFKKEISDGHFFSQGLQIDVDYRRSGTENDLQNVEALISFMTVNSISETVYSGYKSQTAPATLQQLKDLVFEMKTYGVYLYNRKKVIKEQIEAAESIAEVKEITW